MTQVWSALFFLLSSWVVIESKDDLMQSPAADDMGGRTIDEIINAAGMNSIIEKFAALAKTPQNINLYMMDDNQRAGTVRVDSDMLFTADQWANANFLDDTGKRRKKRKAVKGDRYRWKNNIIPYSLARGHFSARDVSVIRAAMADWQRETCLRFRPANSGDKNVVFMQNGGGCSSYVGSIGGRQPLTLAAGCRVKGIVIHEMGHAIGFQHEQTRPDRDQYVFVHKQNIIPSTLFNFKRFSWSSIESKKVPYDYLSVMHYGAYAFSRNRRQTISVKDSRYKGKIGNRKGLSFRDIKLANLIYNCAQRNNCPRRRCPGEGFVDKHCNCRCPGNPIKSCSATGTLRPTRPTPKRTTLPYRTAKPTGGCQDKSAFCKSWSVGNGCRHFYPFMSKVCRHTCALCRTRECIDKNRNCPAWKRANYCRHARYVQYMTVNCARSCDKCALSHTATGQDGKCEDKTPFCRMWSVAGHCESKPDYMKETCAYTCSFC